MADQKIEILRSLYQDKALPDDAMVILSSLDADGKLDVGLDALSKNQQFISSLGGGGKRPPPEHVELEGEKEGLADYLNSLWEGYKGGVRMGMEGLAYPVSGIAGLAKYTTTALKTGSIDEALQQAGKTMEEIQAVPGKIIPAEKAQEAYGQTIETAMEVPGVKPVVKTAMEIPQTIGDLTYEGALKLGLSPETASFFGAAGKSAIPVVIELLNIPGTKVAKKGLLKNALKKADIADFYDDAGALIPEIRQAIDQSGLSMDDVEEFIPKNIVKSEAARETIGTLSEAARPGVGQAGRIRQIAREAKPSKEVWDAAKDLGLEEDIPISHLTAETNPLFASITESVKSIPDSVIGADEAAYIKQMADKAKGLVEEFGGTTDKSKISSGFREESVQLLKDMSDRAEIYYGKVNDLVDPRMVVKADNTIKTIMDRASKKVPKGGDIDVGVKRLSKIERDLLNDLQVDDLTYYALDDIRKDLGQALFKKKGPFADMQKGLLKDLYKQLSKDQFDAIPSKAGKSLYNTARATVAQRKAIETQLTKVIGREIEGDIATFAGNAVKALMDGKTVQFNKLAKNVPKELGKEARQGIFASALTDVMTLGSRKERRLNIAGFDDFMNGLNENKAAKAMLAKELPDGAMDRLDTFHTIVSAARKAQGMATTTGKLVAAPEIMDEMENIWSKMYGIGKATTAAAAIEMGFTGSPGLITIASALGTMGAKKFAKKTRRSVAADKLLTSKKFRNIMKEYASGNIDTPKKIENANKILEGISEYKNWKNSLPKGDLNDLIQTGAIGYIVGPKAGEPEK